jgi:hypothetical protein
LNAILRYGLSSEWSVKTIPTGMSLNEYMLSHLSAAEKTQIIKITKRWLAEAENMARHAILVNYHDVFLPLGKALSKRAELDKNEIESFYNNKAILAETSFEYFEKVEFVKELTTQVEELVSRQESIFNSMTQLKNYSDTSLSEAYKEMYNQDKESSLKPWIKLSAEEKSLVMTTLSRFVIDTRRDAYLYNLASLTPSEIADIDQMAKDDKSKAVKNVFPAKYKKYISAPVCRSLLN